MGRKAVPVLGAIPAFVLALLLACIPAPPATATCSYCENIIECRNGVIYVYQTGTDAPVEVGLTGEKVEGQLLHGVWLTGERENRPTAEFKPVCAGRYYRNAPSRGEFYVLAAAVSNGSIEVNGKPYSALGKRTLKVDWPEFEVSYPKNASIAIKTAGDIQFRLIRTEDTPGDGSKKTEYWAYAPKSPGEKWMSGQAWLEADMSYLHWTFPFCPGSAHSWVKSEVDEMKKNEREASNARSGKGNPGSNESAVSGTLAVVGAALGLGVSGYGLYVLFMAPPRRKKREGGDQDNA